MTVRSSVKFGNWRDVLILLVILFRIYFICDKDSKRVCCSEPHGMSYIETSNLDGETNLKIRQVLYIVVTYCRLCDVLMVHVDIANCSSWLLGVLVWILRLYPSLPLLSVFYFFISVYLSRDYCRLPSIFGRLMRSTCWKAELALFGFPAAGNTMWSFNNTCHIWAQTPLSIWAHLFCGSGHEKRRGEQLKWSLAFSLYIGSFLCAQLPGPVHTARLGQVYFCVFSLGLYFVYSFMFLWFVCVFPSFYVSLGSWVISFTVFGVSITNLN